MKNLFSYNNMQNVSSWTRNAALSTHVSDPLDRTSEQQQGLESLWQGS